MANGNGKQAVAWSLVAGLLGVLATGAVGYFTTVERISQLPTRDEVKAIVAESSVTTEEARMIASEVVSRQGPWAAERSGVLARLEAEERSTAVIQSKLDQILEVTLDLKARMPRD